MKIINELKNDNLDSEYQKNLNMFISNITAEDADIRNKLSNLLEGGQLSDDIYNVLLENERLQSIIAEKVVQYVKTSEDAEGELLEKMDQFAEWYSVEELKKFDFRDALYNCDGIYLEIISECLSIPADQLTNKLNNMKSFENEGFKIKRDGQVFTLTPQEMSEFRYLNEALNGKSCLECYNTDSEEDLEIVERMMQDEDICYSIREDILDNLSEDSGALEADVIEDHINRMRSAYER